MAAGGGLLLRLCLTTLRGADFLACARHCDPAVRVPAVQVVLEREGAPDSVHRQSADLPVVLQRRVPTVLAVQEDRRDPSSAVLGDPCRSQL